MWVFLLASLSFYLFALLLPLSRLPARARSCILTLLHRSNVFRISKHHDDTSYIFHLLLPPPSPRSGIWGDVPDGDYMASPAGSAAPEKIGSLGGESEAQGGKEAARDDEYAVVPAAAAAAKKNESPGDHSDRYKKSSDESESDDDGDLTLNHTTSFAHFSDGGSSSGTDSDSDRDSDTGSENDTDNDIDTDTDTGSDNDTATDNSYLLEAWGSHGNLPMKRKASTNAVPEAKKNRVAPTAAAGGVEVPEGATRTCDSAGDDSATPCVGAVFD